MNEVLKHFRIDTTQADRVTVWIDVADRSVNVLFESVFDELERIVDALQTAHSELPVVFRSAKRKGFIVGADLRSILAIETDVEIQAFLLRGQHALECLEQLDHDAVAVMVGPSLGGGLEFALACRWRVADDSAATILGMPEAKLGLMPGWGGTQRLLELIGIDAGLEMLLSGEPILVQTAFDLQLIDAKWEETHFESELTTFLAQLAEKKHHRRKPVRAMDESSELKAVDLRAACKRLGLEPSTAAQHAIMAAVEIGIRQSRQAGFREERVQFFSLLNSPAVRDTLRRFASPPQRRAGDAGTVSNQV